MKEQNTDICVVMDVDEAKGTITVYSPLKNENITVSVTEEIMEGIDANEAIAFEIDLDTKTII